MEIYRYFPDVEQSLAYTTLKTIKQQNRVKNHSEINIRMQLARLELRTVGDVLVHGAAALGKLIVAIVQLPLYPMWEGTAPDLAFVEAGSHAARAFRSAIAAIVVPLPAMASPDFALSAYEWLALNEAAKDGLLGKLAARVSHLMSHLLTKRNLIRTLLTAVAVTSGVLGYKYFNPSPEESTGWGWTPWIIGIFVVGVTGIGIASARTGKSPRKLIGGVVEGITGETAKRKAAGFLEGTRGSCHKCQQYCKRVQQWRKNEPPKKAAETKTEEIKTNS
jgi:hypothetical protein